MTAPESVKIPLELLEQFEYGNVLLFIGEEINHTSINEQALPLLVDLAQKLAIKSEYPTNDQLTFQRVAYFYERKTNRNQLISFIYEQLAYQNLPPLLQHQLVSQLPASMIITTTYDDMLERVHREQRIPFATIIRNQDVAYTDRQKRQLIWLFGRLDQPDTLRLTEAEQAAVLEEQLNLSDVLRAGLAQHTWLILGFDIQPEWFRRFYTSVMRRLDTHGRKAYFCGPIPDAFAAEWCQEQQIEVLNSDLTSFLQALAHALNKRQVLQTADPVLEPYPKSPYKGLHSFHTTDQRLFFGREREMYHLADLVGAQRLIILYGASGTGKTSLLQAGLTPLLGKGRPPYMVVQARVLNDPIQDLRLAIQASLPDKKPIAEQPFVEFLADTIQTTRMGLVLVLDQFEEFFVRWNRVDQRRDFIITLANILNARQLQVKVILSLREDWLAAIDEIEALVPEIAHARFRLLPLDREATRMAIEQPVVPFGVHFAPDLVEQLLYDLGSDTAMPTQIQLVCHALYSKLLPNQREITLTDYHELHGIQGILGRFLSAELAKIPTSQSELAQAILEALISSQGTKITRTATDLISALDSNADIIQPILYTLSGHLLHTILRQDQEPLYELAHEYLIDHIKISSDSKAYKQAEELLSQCVENWKQLGTLLGADELALITTQRTKLRLSSAALELLLRSSVAHELKSAYWIQRMPEMVRKELIDRLSIAYHHNHKSNIAALLWALRNYLPPPLYFSVAQYHIRQITPGLIKRWALPVIVLMFIGLIITTLIPIDTGWHTIRFLKIASHKPVIIAVDATHPDLIYLATQTDPGLFRSVDGGMHWEQIGDHSELETVTVAAIAANKQYIYITTSNGVFISRNMGVAWKASTDKTFPTPVRQLTWSIAVSPDNPEIAYLATGDSRLFSTTDGGITWSRLPTDQLDQQTITAIATDGQHLILATQHAIWSNRYDKQHWQLITGTPVQISHDLGATWKPIGTMPISATITGLTSTRSAGYFLYSYGTVIGFADESKPDRYLIDLGQAYGQARSVSVTGQIKIDQMVSISSANYIGTEDSFICRRIWFGYQPYWWLAMLKRDVPCGQDQE